MNESAVIDVGGGRIRYRDSGGDGPPIVCAHGYLVDGRLWDGVLDALGDRFRVIVPDLPLGAHRTAMDPDADLTPPGLAAILGDLIDALDISDVTLVGNDSGGAICQIFAASSPPRLGRLVLTNCDTHENFPPGIFKLLPPIARVPGGTALALAPFRIPAVARLGFRPFTAKPIAPELIADWLAPASHDRAVKHDLNKVTAGMNKRHTLAAAERLRGSKLPLLLAWAPGDLFFPMRYAERLATEVGDASLVQIDGAKSFVPLDQPARVATAIAEFAPAG